MEVEVAAAAAGPPSYLCVVANPVRSSLSTGNSPTLLFLLTSYSLTHSLSSTQSSLTRSSSSARSSPTRSSFLTGQNVTEITGVLTTLWRNRWANLAKPILAMVDCDLLVDMTALEEALMSW
eukprot:CAMPEP_0172567014 /NCGR_PEP_ID=MMETSP1067-20121228/114196_1 /TAXON_ID=265564 ORGANISM="Thalassiosira punctigera, Strain Tpunct2005C2" /NCGR_SAMPLE_ID=MMETSP1067 /ASSEMBLY_ACC=CAM_ASM_000444 /LENGTH=121 /DNA_ID=CAMNT_0013358265 /DNA_START=529 /DNA_END=892 /DNA_ORIENTATION=-